MKNETGEKKDSQPEAGNSLIPELSLDDLNKQIAMAEKRGDEDAVLRLKKDIYIQENTRLLTENVNNQDKLRKEIGLLEKEGKDPSTVKESLKRLETEQKDLENKLLAVSVKTKTDDLENQLNKQVNEADKIAVDIDDPKFKNEEQLLKKEEIAVVAGAEAIMSLNVKDFTLDSLDKEIKAYRTEIKKGEQKNASGKYNEEQILENENKLRRAEEIKKIRLEYEQELKDKELKYQEYEKQLHEKQQDINQTEAWDDDKRAKLVEEKEKIETEFQKFVKDELEPLKAGKKFEVKKENKNIEKSNQEEGNPSEGLEVIKDLAQISAAGLAVEELLKKDETAKNADKGNNKIPENVLEKDNEEKFKKIAGQGAEIVYKSIASRIGVKFLTDLGLTTWAKLGDALHQGESKLFKFAKSNDIYRLLSDKKNTKEVMKVLSEQDEKKKETAQRVEAVRAKIENNERLTSEEKKKYLEQLEGLLDKASLATQANNKNSQEELEKLTRAYLESKSSVVGVAKDMANTVLTVSGALVLRAAMYGASAVAERVSKAGKKYQREYTGQEEKPSKIKYLVKDLCINSVKETMKGLALSKTDEKGRQLKAWERGLNVLRSAGTVYLAAGIGGDAWRQWSDGSEGFTWFY